MKQLVITVAAMCMGLCAAPLTPAHATLQTPVHTTATQSQTEQMTPEMLLSMARLGSYVLSPNGKQVLYIVALPNIKENKIPSRLFLLDVASHTTKDLTANFQGVADPKWIANGTRIAFMAKDKDGAHQLFTMTPQGTDVKQISAVEGGITGFMYSPDEKQVLYTKDIKSDVTAQDIYPDLPKASGRIITDLMYKHWDEWVTTIPHPFLANVGETPFVKGTDLLSGEPYEAPMKPFADLSDFSFSPDGKTIAYACRKKVGLEYAISTNSDIYLYDIASKTTKNLSEGLMGYDTHPTFSPDGKTLAFCSMEHDGYESDLNRLFLIDMPTGKRTYLSQGFECNVESPTWSADGKSIYFVSCVKAEKDIYEISVKSGKIRQITSGQNDYISFDINNKVMVAARHSMTTPTELYAVDLKKGTPTQLTTLNDAVMKRIGEMKCEKRWIPTTNGEKMLVWIMYPKQFDPNKQYPSILYCQGGPQDPISQFWSYRWNPRIMAENGYIVILPNRHGVPSFGKAWNEQISGDYGGQNMQDYLAAADAMKKEPFIDKNRMGCVGASYGGFSVYWLAGHHNKRFACFIAHAGIFNLEAQYLETEEKWFANWDMGGAPWDKNNAVAQRTFANSPNKFVDKWDTPILIIHGEKDYRILASQGMMAFDAARMRGIPTEMLIYPDENHWVLQPQNAVLWQRTFFRWLDAWLKK